MGSLVWFWKSVEIHVVKLRANLLKIVRHSAISYSYNCCWVIMMSMLALLIAVGDVDATSSKVME